MSKDKRELRSYLSRLDNEKISLYIIKGDELLYSSNKSGISPIVEAVEKVGISKLSGSVVVDKIVGKAAALTISYFKARKVFTHLISKSAVEILQQNGVLYEYERLTKEIKAKNGLGICPFEMAVKEVGDPKDGYERLKRILNLVDRG
ncbi:MAG: DUF1893 domain-containing protein [Candidatus Bathyarchaeia archaeon]